MIYNITKFTGITITGLMDPVDAFGNICAMVAGIAKDYTVAVRRCSNDPDAPSAYKISISEANIDNMDDIQYVINKINRDVGDRMSDCITIRFWNVNDIVASIDVTGNTDIEIVMEV